MYVPPKRAFVVPVSPPLSATMPNILGDQSVYRRRMLVDLVWREDLDDAEREACGGESARLCVKSWAMRRPVDRETLRDVFKK